MNAQETIWVKQSCDCQLLGEKRVEVVHASWEYHRGDSWKHFAKLKPHAHPEMHLVILVKGENLLQCDGQKRIWRAPDGVLIDSNMAHEVRPSQRGEIEYLQVTLRLLDEAGQMRVGTWSALAEELGGQSIEPSALTPSVWQRAVPDLQATVQALAVADRLALSARLLALLSTLSSAKEEKLPAKLASLQVMVCRRPEMEWTIAGLANLCGWSSGYLHRYCRDALGITPMEFVYRIRLEKACALLREGNLNLAAIAEICGFTDAYHFSRRFRQRYGLAPGAWRRSHAVG